MAIAPTSSWGKADVVVVILFLALAWITVVARVCVRIKIKSLGLDDYLMCLALVSRSIVPYRKLTSETN